MKSLAKRLIESCQIKESTEETITLYHGSPENTDYIKVEKGGLFDGVFCSQNKESALSHNKHLYAINMPESAIFNSDDDGYIEIRKVFPWIKEDEDIEDIVYDALYFEKYDQYDEIWQEILGNEDPAEIGWELQKMRGQIALALGFRAASMKDEHGTSYLVLRGNTLKRIN